MRDKFPEVSLETVCIGWFVSTESIKCTRLTLSSYLLQVIINFPDPAQKSDIVQLRGPRTEVEKCSKFMQKIVAEMVKLFSCVVLDTYVERHVKRLFLFGSHNYNCVVQC